MPANNLDAATVKAANPRAATYRLSDGGGLLLEVRPTGARVWLCRVTVAGKRRDIGLGGYPGVTLKEARDKAEAVRKQATTGLDPMAERERVEREREAARKAAAESKARTFRTVAAECIAAEAPGWKNARTALLWETSLTRWAYPELGDMPIAEIDRAAVLRAVGEVWRTRPVTGRKVLRRVGAVLRYAAAHGWRANDNPADARMLRYMGLPQPPGGRPHPSLPWAQLPRFWKALDEVEGLGACALRLAILAAVARDALIFPSATRKTPISDMTISAVIRRMNAARGEGDPPPWRDPDGRAAVPHGFRATFSTWGDDMRPHEREAIERALAHEVENKVSGAYRRSDLFDRRVALMAEWAAHVVSGATAVSASVVETPASATAQG